MKVNQAQMPADRPITRERLPQEIAIDGPVASGKSAVGGILASRLGYRFLDTGSMYRALTWSILQQGIDPENEQAVSEAAEAVSMTIEPLAGSIQCAVLINGRDTTPYLTDAEVEKAVSLVSRVPSVRSAMVAIQRGIASEGRVVMAGRDIGTVVMPNAGLKVYLDASPEERAKRRAQQMEAAGEDTDVESILSDLRRRDAIDSGRDLSPLRAALDACIINTDGLSLEEVVDKIAALLP